MFKIWGGKGKRVARVENSRSAFRVSTQVENTSETGVKAKTMQKQEKILDFETLQSWYKESNAPVAAGNESTFAHVYAQKRKSLKFL